MLEPYTVGGQGLRKLLKKTVYWHLREKRVIADAKCIFFTAQREMELAGQVFEWTNRARVLVPYGVRIEHRPASTPQRSSLVVASEQKVALFLGRVHPKKNVEFLLRCWAAARLERSWILVIAGPCQHAYLRRLQRLIGELGISRNVRIVGSVHGADKAYLFERADWFLLPSLQENFGIAVLEAISYSCATAISTEVYIGDSLTGEAEILPLVESEWVAFLRDRMTDPNVRDELRRRSRNASVRFDFDNITRAWAATLTEILSKDCDRP